MAQHSESPFNVYVAQLETSGSISWTSVHTTQEAAERRLLEVAADWGYPGELVNGHANFDDQPDITSYGVSYLPIEE